MIAFSAQHADKQLKERIWEDYSLEVTAWDSPSQKFTASGNFPETQVWLHITNKTQSF